MAARCYGRPYAHLCPYPCCYNGCSRSLSYSPYVPYLPATEHGNGDNGLGWCNHFAFRSQHRTDTDRPKEGACLFAMSQLGYMVLAMGIGSYEAGLFHLVTHAYSKALLFLGAGSVIHGMEPFVGWDPAKSQNLLLMGGLRRFMPITGTTFLLGTLSICGIPRSHASGPKMQYSQGPGQPTLFYGPLLGSQPV